MTTSVAVATVAALLAYSGARHSITAEAVAKTASWTQYVRFPISSNYASPIEFVWTMWTTFHKSTQQQQKQARIFPANF
jgi:hypothetical protein